MWTFGARVKQAHPPPPNPLLSSFLCPVTLSHWYVHYNDAIETTDRYTAVLTNYLFTPPRCSVPLPPPIQNGDGDYAAGRPTSFCVGDLPGGFIGDARRSDSWQASHAAEQERYDAAEARGYGLYALHAVIGQGTFGRIHLASWQHRGGGVDSAAPSTAAPAAATSSRSLSTEGSSSRAGGGAGGRPSAGGLEGEGGTGARESGHPSSYYAGADSTTTAELSGQASSHLSGALAMGAGAAAAAGPRATRRHRDSRTVRSRSALYPAAAMGISGNEEWAGYGERGGAQLRLRALKSVCKRKVTEKGLVRHMETVSDSQISESACGM